MLSCVLNSDQAIKINILVVRTITKMREMLLTHKDLLLKMEELEKRVSNQDEKVAQIFDYLRRFIQEQKKPRTEMGYKKKPE